MNTPASAADPFAISIPRVDNQIVNATPVGEANYKDVDSAVRSLTSIPGLTETILPSIRALLEPGENNPYGKLIDKSTAGNVASAQTDAMRRGLTGSDIEAATMTGARTAGEDQKTAFYAQNAEKMASFIKELATGDINNQRENLMMFAQLMGQKITSDQDLQMFREQLNANMGMAESANRNSMTGALIGAVGSVAGGALSGRGGVAKTA